MSLMEYREFTKSDKLYEESLKLRYKVYCLEWGFENPGDYPEEMEFDYYDDHDMCIYAGAIYRPENKLVGSARLIRVPIAEPMLPIEKECVRRDQIGEVSRMLITKEFSRRRDDLMAVINSDEYNTSSIDPNHLERRKIENDIMVNLLRLLAERSAKLDITHWYCVMAKALHKLLVSKGIDFIQIGPPKQYHGVRIPYIGYLENLFGGNEYISEAYNKTIHNVEE